MGFVERQTNAINKFQQNKNNNKVYCSAYKYNFSPTSSYFCPGTLCNFYGTYYGDKIVNFKCPLGACDLDNKIMYYNANKTECPKFCQFNSYKYTDSSYKCPKGKCPYPTVYTTDYRYYSTTVDDCPLYCIEYGIIYTKNERKCPLGKCSYNKTEVYYDDPSSCSIGRCQWTGKTLYNTQNYCPKGLCSDKVTFYNNSIIECPKFPKAMYCATNSYSYYDEAGYVCPKGLCPDKVTWYKYSTSECPKVPQSIYCKTNNYVYFDTKYECPKKICD